MFESPGLDRKIIHHDDLVMSSQAQANAGNKTGLVTTAFDRRLGFNNHTKVITISLDFTL